MALYASLFERCPTEADALKAIAYITENFDVSFPRYKHVADGIRSVIGSGGDEAAPDWRRMVPTVRKWAEEWQRFREFVNQPVTFAYALRCCHAEAQAASQEMPWDDWWKQRTLAFEELLRQEGVQPVASSMGAE